MNDPKQTDFSYDARRIATRVRLTYLQGYIAVGMIDLAADQFALIDSLEMNDPAVRAVKIELEKARSVIGPR